MPSIEQVLAEGIEPFYAWYAVQQQQNRKFDCYCTDCPVYYYLTERTGRQMEVHKVHIWDAMKQDIITLPKEFQDWIHRYDREYLEAMVVKEK